MLPFSATEQDLHCGDAIFSRGCMHFISFEAEEKPCWDSVILPPGCPFVSHYVLNLIPFYSHNDSQMKQHNYRNTWSYPFGLSSADLSRDCHMPSQKLKSCIGDIEMWQAVYIYIYRFSISSMDNQRVEFGIKEFNIWVNSLRPSLRCNDQYSFNLCIYKRIVLW